MRIDSYDFGKIIIDGVTYTSDVILLEEQVNSSWWRKESHLLESADLEDVVQANPEFLVIGTGRSGVMKVPQETQEFLRSKGIVFVIEKTGDACRTYNQYARERKVAAALHLTC
ncbi:MAG: Mth938-like domain-containing protein [Thermoplasmata archaeon]